MKILTRSAFTQHEDWGEIISKCISFDITYLDNMEPCGEYIPYQTVVPQYQTTTHPRMYRHQALLQPPIYERFQVPSNSSNTPFERWNSYVTRYNPSSAFTRPSYIDLGLPSTSSVILPSHSLCSNEDRMHHIHQTISEVKIQNESLQREIRMIKRSLITKSKSSPPMESKLNGICVKSLILSRQNNQEEKEKALIHSKQNDQEEKEEDDFLMSHSDTLRFLFCQWGLRIVTLDVLREGIDFEWNRQGYDPKFNVPGFF